MDKDGSGDITLGELEGDIQNARVQAYFSHLNLDIDNAWQIFEFLDEDAIGTVSIEEFVFGCLRLRGYATTIDVQSLQLNISKQTKKMVEFMDFSEGAFQQLNEDILLLRSVIRTGPVDKMMSI